MMKLIMTFKSERYKTEIIELMKKYYTDDLLTISEEK